MDISAGAMEVERVAWNGKTYPVLDWPVAEYVRDHLREYHGYVAPPYDRPDTRSDDEVLMRHERMHAISRDGLVDAHFHVERMGLPPLPITFEDQTADVIEQRFEDVNAGWRELLALADGPNKQAVEDNAVYYVLVNVFGSREQYLFEPRFHGQVVLAAQMLKQVLSKTRRGEADAQTQ
jgi:hypothetical protein